MQTKNNADIETKTASHEILPLGNNVCSVDPICFSIPATSVHCSLAIYFKHTWNVSKHRTAVPYLCA
jgi:hypothetical protein